MWNWRSERAIESVTLVMSERGLPLPNAELTCHLCMAWVINSNWGNITEVRWLMLDVQNSFKLWPEHTADAGWPC